MLRRIMLLLVVISVVLIMGACEIEITPIDTITELEVGYTEYDEYISGYGYNTYDFYAAGTGWHTIYVENTESNLSWRVSTSSDYLDDSSDILECNDYSYTHDEIDDVYLTGGNHYYIFVDEWDDESGYYDILVEY